MGIAKLTFLGTGTSQGVPMIGCKCEVCQSPDEYDKRFRSSVFVEYEGLNILVDAGPDFRSQMLKKGISHLDAILLTHNHRDHTGGLDDVRSLNYIDRKVVDIYCEEYVLNSLQSEYPYAFAAEKYPGAPEWEINLIENEEFYIVKDNENKELVWISGQGYCYKLKDGSLIPTDNHIIKHAEKQNKEGVKIIPIRGLHDNLPVLGFRFGNIAYITDMSFIPEEEFKKLSDLDHVTLNTVGYKPHHSHFNLDKALEIADKIGAKNTWLTHLSHTFPRHKEFENELQNLCRDRQVRSVIRPAFDGLTIS